ncbi:MAG: acyltransferase family protein [Deltaproteobacteria bacterium]|nr:acyltransferase family protein [Deltaproteobacteria bacterium]
MTSSITTNYLRVLRFLRSYHRWSGEGLHHLLTDQACLIVGYHGRGLPPDLGVLTLEIYERKGYLPHFILHKRMWEVPVINKIVDDCGAVPGDGERIREAVARGESLVVAPGGTQEMARSFRTRYEVDFGRRRGYLKFALQLGIPIVPVGSAGCDEVFIGLNDGHRLSRRLGLPKDIPLWFGVGLTGLYPLSLPMPVKLHTIVGEPIDPHQAVDLPADHPDFLERLNAVVTGRLQGLLDQARAR